MMLEAGRATVYRPLDATPNQRESIMKSANRVTLTMFTAALIAGSAIARAQAQQPTVPERVAGLKTGLAASQAALRQYEWFETTVVSLKGEEKSSKQQRCYYGADGTLQKVDVAASPEPEARRGVRGRVVANKTEELTDYMQDAVALVKSYLPPDPALIQAAQTAGTATMETLEPGKRGRLHFANYRKAGDDLGVEIDLATNSLLGVTVSTYLDDPKDAVTLVARMGKLADGTTTYTSDITLDAVAKGVKVAITNSGYRKTN